MARLRRDIRYTFTGGEISPLLVGRSDLQKHFSSVETCKNFIVTPYGPVERRSGTRHVAEVKDSSKQVKQVPFQYTASQGYMLEFGDLYMRVYRNGGQVQSGGAPFELVTPYTEAQLVDLQVVQRTDHMYIVHPSHPPKKLERTADDAWTLTTVVFEPPPTSEEGFKPSATLTPAATTGNGINFTASASVFLASDVGRELDNLVGTGHAIITSVTSATVVVADITEDFPNTNAIASGNWKLDFSPNTTITPDGKNKGTLVTFTLTAAGWRSGDVGKYIHMNKGIAKIDTFISTTVVRGKVMKSLTNTTAAAGEEWTLEEEVWTSANGYPRAISSHENRLLFGGTAKFPNGLWGSTTDDFVNFGRGTTDDDSFSFFLATTFTDTIQWISPLKRLFVGSFGSENVVNDGQNDPITPTNIVVRSESNAGSPHLQPIRVDGSLVFINRHQNKLIELGFNFQDDSFVATNLLLLAEHLAGPCAGTITRLAFQRESRPIIWCVRTDGVLLGFTFDRRQNVIGAHRHTFGGAFSGASPVVEDVAVLPHWSSPYDTVWLVVKRTVNGVTKRYIEYIDRDLNTDSTLTRAFDGVLVSSVSGLTHLEGQTVWVIGDGTPQAQRTVTSGAVTVSPAASAVEVGLNYDSILKTLPIQGPGLQLLGLVKRVVKVVANFYQTVDAKINGKSLTLGTSAAPYTDEVEVENLGYDKKGQVTIEQVRPLPMTILELAGETVIDEDRR